MIYFATQCLNFELRFCFQVSSILQQQGNSWPILIDCATLEGDLNPHRFPVCNILEYHPTSREVFAKRALVRNEQIKRAQKYGAPWIFFADCDHVYSRDFFAKLDLELEELEPWAPGCISGNRKLHSHVHAADQLALRAKGNPFIPGAYDLASVLPMMAKKNRQIAGGAMQVCSLTAIEERSGGLYVPEDETKDNDLFEQGQRARSDIQFRNRMGGSTMIDLPTMIHLQHRRDKEEGCHLEIQR